MLKKEFTDQEKENIIKEYTIDKISAKKLGEKYGCSNTTLLKNLKDWGIEANSRKIDLTGQVFGKLTVIESAPKRDKYTRWICQCECGNLAEVRSEYLKNGHTTSCGCKRNEQSVNFQDLTGNKYGKWTVLKKAEKESYWLCECECGIQKEVYAPSLKKGLSTSCGNCGIRNNIHKSLIGKSFGKLTVIEQPANGSKKCKCKCECGNVIWVKTCNLISNNTKSCGCIKSKGELAIQQLLNKNNIPYVAQYNPMENPKYKFDFYINNEYIVEFDGPQHYGQIGGYYTNEVVSKIIKRDIEKNQYCLDNNIPLYRIPYEYRYKITLELLKDERFRVKKAKHYQVD